MVQEKALREAWGEILVEMAQENPNIVVLDGDLANSTRADIFADACPDRFLEMGIAEQNMLGVAAGLSTMGYIPFISTFAAFAANRALDQIRVVIAQPRLNVKITGSYSGLLTGKTGKTHQDFSDLATFRSLPNMVVVSPADAVELRKALATMIDYDGPVYLRLTRDPSPIIFKENDPFEFGKGLVLREGGDVALISTGVQTVRALKAAEILEEDGLQAYVLHLSTLKPIDEEAIIDAARRTGCVVTTEDHSIIGGLGGTVAEVLGENYPTRIARVGIRDVFGESAPNEALLKKYGLTAEHIAGAARKLLGVVA